MRRSASPPTWGPCWRWIDQRGYGQVRLGEQAMQMAIKRAQAHGSCIMSLAQAHHLGRIGHFAEMAVAQGLVSLHFVNVLSRPVVAPWGGADGRFGTNPCCIGIPLPGRPDHAGSGEACCPLHPGLCHRPRGAGQDAGGLQPGQQVAPGTLIDEVRQAHHQPGGGRGATVATACWALC